MMVNLIAPSCLVIIITTILAPPPTSGQKSANFTAHVRQFLESQDTLLGDLRDDFVKRLNSKPLNSSDYARNAWASYGHVSRQLVDTVIRNSLSKVVDFSFNVNISNTCSRTLLSAVTGLRTQRSDVMRLIDATGNLWPSGLLDATITSLGSFDSCLNIDGDMTAADHQAVAEPIVGQYCLLHYQMPLPPKPKPLTLQSRVLNFSGSGLDGSFIPDLAEFAIAFYDRFGRIGLCVPATCSKHDFQQVIDYFTKDTGVKATIANCVQPHEDFNFTATHLVIIICIAIIVILVLAGTVTDQLNLQSPQNLVQCLLCFSFRRNWLELFDDRPLSPSVIGSINGLKSISMAWIIYTHTYLVPIKETFAFSRYFILSVSTVAFQFILNGWVLVDTFFLLSATLVTMSVLRSSSKVGSKYNPLSLILTRVVRLLPVLWLTVSLCFLLPSLGSGPLWLDYWTREAANCRHTCWASLAFLSNWIDADNICLLHTWYVAAELQLFIIGMVCIAFVCRYPRFATMALVPAIVLFSLAVGLVTALNDYPPTVMYNTPMESDVLTATSQVYTPLEIHVSSYLIGILLGHELYKVKQLKSYTINSTVNLVAWAMSLLTMVTIMLITLPWNQGVPWTPVTAGLYAGLHRTLWSVAIAWIVFSCATGHGGLINYFLSMKVFDYLSKLSYSVYLLHFLVLWARYASLRYPLPFSHYTMFCEFITNWLLSTMVAIVVYLTIESPLLKLYRVLTSDRTFGWADISLISIKRTQVKNGTRL